MNLSTLIDIVTRVPTYANIKNLDNEFLLLQISHNYIRETISDIIVAFQEDDTIITYNYDKNKSTNKLILEFYNITKTSNIDFTIEIDFN